MKNIDNGSYLEKIKTCNALSVHKFSLLHAFIRATPNQCYRCNGYTVFIHIFTLKKVCGNCFDQAIDNHLPEFAVMVKTKAKEQYLLNDRDIASLCHTTTGDTTRPLESTVLVSRLQVKELAGESI